MAVINTSKLEFNSEGNTYIFDKNIGAAAVGQDIYSTDEIVVGKWIDGRPVYRKSISFSGLPNNASTQVPIGNIQISELVDLHGYASNSAESLPLPYSHPSNLTYNVGADVRGLDTSSPYVLIFTKFNYSSYNKGEIVVEYTKTTDAPGSYTPSGTELTEEHLTGDTYNGKPVYEVVVDAVAGSALNTNNNIYNVTSLNIDTVVAIDAVRNNDPEFLHLNYAETTGVNISVGVNKNTNQIIEYHTQSFFTGNKLRVALKYTKKN